MIRAMVKISRQAADDLERGIVKGLLVPDTPEDIGEALIVCPERDFYAAAEIRRCPRIAPADVAARVFAKTWDPRRFALSRVQVMHMTNDQRGRLIRALVLGTVTRLPPPGKRDDVEAEEIGMIPEFE